MGDPMYEGDKVDSWQPFSFGPRNLLGGIWRTNSGEVGLGFDLELCEKSQGWAERQKVFISWDKGQLWVGLKDVEMEKHEELRRKTFADECRKSFGSSMNAKIFQTIIGIRIGH